MDLFGYPLTTVLRPSGALAGDQTSFISHLKPPQRYAPIRHTVYIGSALAGSSTATV